MSNLQHTAKVYLTQIKLNARETMADNMNLQRTLELLVEVYSQIATTK